MLVIFPFEETFYRARGVDAEFIGHPLLGGRIHSTSRCRVRPMQRSIIWTPTRLGLPFFQAADGRRYGQIFQHCMSSRCPT